MTTTTRLAHSHSSNDSIGDRMKRYESTSHHTLLSRIPVIIRVDGRAFHTFTRGLERPFDPDLIDAMTEATQTVMNSIQGCKLAYTQSDEASFLLTDYDTLETQPWFGYDLAKVVSISASTMTAEFNREWSGKFLLQCATFDSRAFNIPLDDVSNYFLWRVKDWRRNSVQMLAQSHFSPRQLHGKKQGEMLAMLEEGGVKWSELPDHLRNGRFVVGDRIIESIEPTFVSVDSLVKGLV